MQVSTAKSELFFSVKTGIIKTIAMAGDPQFINAFEIEKTDL